LAARFRNELLTGHDGLGLRSLLDAHAAEILSVEVSDGVGLEDMDTPADYDRHLQVGIRRAGIVNK
jgi:CTP:molybdopterin cytidylyltransferase MocA